MLQDHLCLEEALYIYTYTHIYILYCPHDQVFVSLIAYHEQDLLENSEKVFRNKMDKFLSLGDL